MLDFAAGTWQLTGVTSDIGIFGGSDYLGLGPSPKGNCFAAAAYLKVPVNNAPPATGPWIDKTYFTTFGRGPSACH